ADQPVANQVAHRLAACRIALFVDVLVERLEQGRLEGNADASQFRHMGTRRKRGWSLLSSKTLETARGIAVKRRHRGPFCRARAFAGRPLSSTMGRREDGPSREPNPKSESRNPKQI